MPAVQPQYLEKNYIEKELLETKYFDDKFKTVTKSSALPIKLSYGKSPVVGKNIDNKLIYDQARFSQ